MIRPAAALALFVLLFTAVQGCTAGAEDPTDLKKAKNSSAGENGDSRDSDAKSPEEKQDGESSSSGPAEKTKQEELSLDEQSLAALLRGVGFLMGKQSEDGGWHSKTYGAMKCGASMTSLVLYAMSHAPEEMREEHASALRQGYDFLRQGIEAKGFVVCPDGSLDYPVYASAMTWLAVRRVPYITREEEFGDRRIELDALLRFLIEEQRIERHSFEPGNVEYGGWDLVGGSGLAAGKTPGTQVSVTSFALEALSMSNKDDAQRAVGKARDWVLRLQNPDGGFRFHAKPDQLGNKAQWVDMEKRDEARSYGTATCDGLRCYLSCGGKPSDEPFQQGVKWLEKHAQSKLVPGFEFAAPELQWDRGLRYYYYFSLAKLWSDLPRPLAERLRTQVLGALLPEQRDDGRWQNESAAMREDDPLIATCFAVIALTEAQFLPTAD